MRLKPLFLVPAAVALVLGADVGVAQIEGGGRGVAPIDSSSDYEVSGITVDVAAKNADAARLGGWRLAQRRAWAQLSRRLGVGGGQVSDSTLDSIVSGIVVENEQIGPTRYVAKLGVLFNRDRAGAMLGISNYVLRSPPMVVIPVVWSGGVATGFEQRTLWQEAWARYRTGGSAIDYIRPTGSGPDPLLLNYGQTQRPGRGWWRAVLDQYGGSDVLMPTVRLYRQWPGGPVIAVFQARQGPDNRLLEQFTLRVGSVAGVPALLDAGVKRLDETYQSALRAGYLRSDPGLSYVPPSDVPEEDEAPGEDLVVETPIVASVGISVQFDTPGVGAVNAAEAAMRGVPGVTAANTSSLALGGVSVMAIAYAGPPDAFKAALEARGWQVFGSGTTLRIRRAPRLLPPDLTADNATAG
ncbi:heavy-metal-associated domain-containing protein [Sphingomonas radiodurans]|uniref:heavy-metal-associated domain-containing protein n=1 Tax=Sphingomonas radiodurans TaxID=2890321 RepID=UPI001E54C659|nr:heavy-metal-associated domain-containing protein [Sphingomonas radiodurans]WBH16559.1 heavy-metal-associated domain-containing protein [Sphingomonas radiodurans]